MTTILEDIKWKFACTVDDIPEGGGAGIYVGKEYVAIFSLKRRKDWFAIKNYDPKHPGQFFTRGSLGLQGQEPTVTTSDTSATYYLRTGENISDPINTIDILPIRIETGLVYIGLAQ